MKLVKSEFENLFYDPTSGIIYFVKRVDGRLLQFSTGIKIPLFKKAKEVANREMKKRLFKSTRVKALLGQLMDQYLDESDKEALRGNISQSTCVKRRQIVAKLRPFWGERRPEEITVDTWAEYCDYFEATWPGERFFDVRKYMRHFCGWLKDRQVISSVPTLKNPFANKERRERKKKKERIFTDDEVGAILKACGSNERLIVLLMYTMAFRIQEACALKWASLDLKSGVYRFGEDDNKASLEGSQAIHSVALGILREMKKNGPYVFPQRNDPSKHIRPQMIDWKAIKEASGVTWGWTPHTFRHTCLTKLFSNPKNSNAAIMKCFRISYKVALEHYIHIDENARNALRDAIEVDYGRPE